MRQLLPADKYFDFVVEKSKNEDDCWIWHGFISIFKNNIKHGVVYTGGEFLAATRYTYARFIEPLDKNLRTILICNRELCVNPKHIRLVTLNEQLSYNRKVINKIITTEHVPWLVDPEVSFLSRVDKETPYGPDGDCWRWLDGKGNYGAITLPGIKEHTSHRVSYALFKGEIPPKLFVCHKCDVRDCVNPEHLWLGTNKENIRDLVNKGLDKSIGSRNYWAKLNENKVQEIRRRYIPNKVTAKTLAKEYGVSEGIIKGVVQRKSWKHVP